MAKRRNGAGTSSSRISVSRLRFHLDRGLKIRTLTLPDMFQDQDKPEAMYAAAGLDARRLVTLGQVHGAAVLAAMGLARSRSSGCGTSVPASCLT